LPETGLSSGQKNSSAKAAIAWLEIKEILSIATLILSTLVLRHLNTTQMAYPSCVTNQCCMDN